MVLLPEIVILPTWFLVVGWWLDRWRLLRFLLLSPFDYENQLIAIPLSVARPFPGDPMASRYPTSLSRPKHRQL